MLTALEESKRRMTKSRHLVSCSAGFSFWPDLLRRWFFLLSRGGRIAIAKGEVVWKILAEQKLLLLLYEDRAADVSFENLDRYSRGGSRWLIVQ